MTFDVSLDVASSEEVSASWATAGVTAAAGADYTESSATVVFSAGVTSRTIVVPVLSDDLDEADETFTVTLSGVQNAALSVSEATGTITDDDDAPALSVSAPSAAAVEGTDTSLVFTVTLAPASGREVTVGYATSDGTATAPGDYTAAADATLTFAPGETSKSVTVPIVDDDLDEEDETFTVMLSDPSGATVATDAATGTIEDDDDPPELGVEDVTASEDAGDLTFVVTLSAASGREVTVSYATSDGTAEQPADYAETSGTLTFAAGVTERTVAVAVVDDAVDEEDETLTLTLSRAENAPLAGGGTTLAATGTIEDDDVPPTVSVSDEQVSEDAGTVSFTVTLDVVSGLAATVSYATSDDTAVAPDDYAETSGTLTIAAGDTEGTISVPVVDDAVDEEEEESFTLTLSAPGNAVLAGGAEQVTATGTIVDDDDPAVEVSFGAAEYTAAEGGSAATVTVQLNVDPEREVTIPLTVTNAGGASDGDHSGVPTELVFRAGEALFQTFEVEAVDDAIDDDGESVVLGFGTLLPEGVTAVAPEAATVTLTDDDARGVQASPTSLSVNENESTSYTVVLTSAPTADVTVTVNGSDGTDLTAPTEGLVLTFTPENWSTRQPVTVTAGDDIDVLADAPVELTHTVAGGDYGFNGVVAPVVTVTIVENDTATLSVTDASAEEGDGYVAFTVTLSEASSATVTVDYATSDGAAVAPDDYTATSGTLTFTVPDTSRTIQVLVVDDTVDEAEEETFTLTLSEVVQAGLAGGADTLAVTGTITDDDDPAVAVSFGAEMYEAAEGGAPVTVTVRLDKDPEREVVIPLTATPGKGATTADYTLSATEVRFAAGGELSRTLTLRATNDAIDDNDETVQLGLGARPERVTAGTPSSAVVTLTDDDQRGVTVSVTELTIQEGESGGYTVVLGSEPTLNVTVTVNGSGGTHLTAPAEGQVLTFTAETWSVPQTVTVTAPADADAVVPPAVTLTHVVAGGDYAGEAAGSVTVRTEELTVPTLTLSPSAATVSESVGGTGQAFTVTLNVASSETVTVGYATADGTAASGADYTAASGTLTFAPEEALTQTFSVPILSDALDEDDETFTVSLRGAVQATVASGTATVTITDDDALPALNLPSGFVIANEGDGALTVTVSLSTASGREVRVDYASSDGGASPPATAGEDYGPVDGTLTFPAGTTTQTFTVSIIDDVLDEETYELFTVTLSGPVNAALGSEAQKVFRIADNDAAPTLNLSPAPAVSVVEGLAVTFTATLSAPSSLPVNLRWETSNGTATTPGDYTATAGLVDLQIPAGQTSRTFLVSTTDDALDEEDTETFGVRIRPSSRLAVNATMGADRTTVSIVDNDEPTALHVADVAAREDTGSLVFTVRLDAPSAKEVTVGYALSPGTATAGEDYTAVPAGTLTFTAGTTERTVTVPLVNDAVHEPDETVTLALSGAVNATLQASSATGTITNDEPLPLLTLGLNPDSIDESAGTSMVMASLSGLSSEPVTVTVATAAGAGTAADDFTQRGRSLTIAAGSTGSTGSVTVTAVDDDVDSPDKTVTVSGSVTGGNGVAPPPPRALTIRDNEVTPDVTLSLSPSSIGENGGTSAVTASLSRLSSAAVTVEVSAAPGTGATADDFRQRGTTLEIGAGSLTSMGTVTVAAVDNVFDAADKTVTVTGTVTGGSAQDPSPERLTIEDDEALMVSVTAAAPTVAEGSAATFPVTVRGGTSTSPVVVTYQVAGTATSGVDYTSPGETLTLDAGGGSGEITIQTLDEMVLDHGETLIVSVTGASASTGALDVVSTPAETTIVDMGRVSVSVTADGAVTEGTSATFTVELSGAVGSAVRLDWSTSDGTATAGLDYTAQPSGMVTFAAGSTAAQTISVATLPDTLAESEETFTLTLSGSNLPAGVSVGTSTATGTITDDESLTVSVAANASTVVEGGAATFTVSVAGGASTAPVAVTYGVGGTATSGADYTAPSGTLTLGAGASRGTITIPTLTDMVLDPGETLTVTLSTASTTVGAVTADSTPAETTIDDTGMVTVSVTAGDAVTEGSSATFSVALSGSVSSPVTVGWSTSNGTATAGVDYTAVSSGTLRFPANSTASQTLTVATLPDTLAESEETFTVTLSGSSLPAGVSVGTSTATGTITDDESLTVAVTADASTVVEGGAATFTVSVAGGSSTAPVTVTYTVGGTASSGTDYTAPSGTLTLSSGAASGTITIATLSDTVLEGGETLAVMLSDASTSAGEVTANATAAQMTIDDTGMVTVSVTAGDAVTEGSSATFSVALSGSVSSPVTVGWSTSNGTATAGVDYTAVSSGTLRFPANSTASQTLTVATLPDTLAESEETFTVTLSGSSLPAGVSVGTSTATGTITDDESLTVAVTADASTVVEGGAATFTVSVAGGSSTAPVTVTYTVGGTASSGTDYTAPSRTLTLGTGASRGTITIPTLSDSVLDAGETLTVTLSAASTSLGTVTADSTPAETTIADSGTVTVSVTAGDAVTEGSPATFTVALSGAVSSAVTVGWLTSDGTATAGDDYTAVSSGTLTFPATSTASQTLTVATLPDTLAESEETFTLTLTGSSLPAGVSVGTSTATGTITDDESLTVAVTADATTVVEGNDATFTVSVTGGTSTAPVQVTYTVSGTASSGADYTAPSGTLTLGAGASSGTITIATLSDTVLDPGETLVVVLSGASTSAGQVTAEETPAQTTIADSGTVTVSVAAGDAVGEGEPATFTVTLSGSVSSLVTVGWSTSDGTATAGDDYTAVSSGTVTLPAESTAAQTLSVATLPDALAEGDETLTVTLTAPDLPDGVSLGTATATAAITDDDALRVSVTADVSTVVEGDDATFTVAVAGGTSTAPVTVTYTVGGTASSGADYTAPSGTLTLDAGAASGTITVSVLADSVLDADETLAVTLTGASTTAGEVTADSSAAETTISDTGTVTVSVASDGAVTEGEQATFTVALSGAVPSAVAVGWSTSDGTATAGDDYLAVSSTVRFAADSTASQTLTVSTLTDMLAEAEETFTVTLTGSSLPAGVSLGTAEATATITDAEEAAAATGVALRVAPSTVPEGAGATEVTVTATLNGPVRSSDTAVTVSVLGDSASTEDFAAVSDFALTIPANGQEGTATFTLTPADDTEAEGPETVSVTGTTDVPGLTVTAAELTIADDDTAADGVTLSVAPSAVPEDAGATEVTVTATLNGAPLIQATVVTVSVSGDSASADDFAAVTDFTVTIPANGQAGTARFTLTPTDDAEEEGPETVSVTGTTDVPGLTVTAAELTIVDDEASESVTPNEPPKFEQERYAFDLPENRSGQEAPVVLGAVGARDSDADRLRYALFDGDRERFTVSGGSGTVSYIGEGEDFETDPSQFELQVTATDGESQTKADVVVRVVDMPERPKASNDRAETPEDTPKVIDVLSNDRDPDGDRLRVASVTVPEHGTATVVSGGVRYAPELNWYGEDRFKYTVADSGGLTSKATVKVTVTPVNDPPEAVDDEAETLEDVPMVVDVLANDTDVDGDPLEVVAVGSAGYGTTAIADGGVRYASELNWYGTDRFTYTIADPEGLTSTATVTMTVLPVNDAPEAVGVIPDQVIEEGGEPVTVDITPYFTDVDGDVLTYEAVSSDETAVTVSVSVATLTLSAMVAGTATVTVTASDVEGLTATQTFGVRVGDRLVRGVLTDTLAALGRGHLSSARMTIGRRLETGGGGMTRLMVAGQYLSLDAWDRMGAGGLEQTHELLFRAATLQQRRSATDLVGTSADPRLLRPGAMSLMGGGLTGPGGGSDRLLQGTDVLLSFGGDDAPAGVGGMGGRWTVWGQGDLQSFRGAPAETSGYDGDLRTGYLGVDARLGERWLAGVAVARSGGAGNWQVGASSGRLATELTVLHPYVRWGDRETAVWALAGVGRGTAENVRALNGRRGASALGLGLGLVEGRRRLATTGGGLEVDLRGEASWARLRTGEGEETIDGLEAGVRRLRTGVEVTLPLGGPGGLMVAPFGEVSTRHDGGAGQTGVGLEFAGGMRLTGGRLRLEAQGRMLALHTATDYEERGVSVTATVGGGQHEPGLTASLRPRWGAQGVGADSLWQDQLQTYTQGAGRNDGGVDARVGYGLRMSGGRLLTPFGGYGQMGSGRRVQVGANLGMAGLFGGDLSSPVQIEFLGERYGRPGSAPDHRVTLFGIVNFGAGAARAVQPGGRGVRRRRVRPARRAAPASMNPVDWTGRPRGCRPLPMQ